MIRLTRVVSTVDTAPTVLIHLLKWQRDVGGRGSLTVVFTLNVGAALRVICEILIVHNRFHGLTRTWKGICGWIPNTATLKPSKQVIFFLICTQEVKNQIFFMHLCILLQSVKITTFKLSLEKYVWLQFSGGGRRLCGEWQRVWWGQ